MKTYRVRVPGGAEHTVQAESVKVKRNGCLVFKLADVNSPSRIIKAYSTGQWCTVVECKPAQDEIGGCD